MVFSQTSVKTHSILKVVEIDRLKPAKNQQVNGPTGVAYGIDTGSPPSPMATTSFSEVYLKPEPAFDAKMFHDSDCEFFQDLVKWCSTPAKEEQVQTIDSPKKIDDRAHNTDTLHTLSPHGWDGFDVNSPTAQVGHYNTTPNDPLSPNVDGFTPYDNSFLFPPNPEKDNKIPFCDQFLDISSLPVVIENITPENVADMNPWQAAEPVDWTNLHDTDHTHTHNTMPFIDQEDSLDMKFTRSVRPREVESNDVIISEYIVNDERGKGGVLEEARVERRGPGLSVDVSARPNTWLDDIISTPEVLTYVEQLEKEKCPIPTSKLASQQWPTPETSFTSTDTCTSIPTSAISELVAPITPKSESQAESDCEDVRSGTSRRRRHDSEESDETYTPYTEHTTPRKYKRRKPNVPIKDMIIALEGSQQLTKARRGRPPKRRESTISSACSVDENSSTISTHESKYRELRDKNNEASKRSRMNRKLKELQMEQLADELEERNKKLKVRADILEDMTKRLKDALMTAILHK